MFPRLVRFECFFLLCVLFGRRRWAFVQKFSRP